MIMLVKQISKCIRSLGQYKRVVPTEKLYFFKTFKKVEFFDVHSYERRKQLLTARVIHQCDK